VTTVKEYYDRYLKVDLKEGQCKTCGKPTKFLKPSQGYRTYCSVKCSTNSTDVINKAKATYKHRTGYEHNSLNPENEKKRKETCLRKYGVDNYFKDKDFIKNNSYHLKENADIINKTRKETCLQKYGVDNVSKSDSVKNKMKQTFINKYGVDNPLKVNEISARVSKSIDYDDPLRLKKIKEARQHLKFKEYKSKCDSIGYKLISLDAGGIIICKCDKGHEFNQQQQLFRLRMKKGLAPCTVCKPLYEMDTRSQAETEICNFIKSFTNEYVKINDRTLLKDRELDIYMPNKKIAIEFNGLYWHSEVHKCISYHLDKTESVESLGFQLIHIYEDDWNYKQNIVKSRLKSVLGFNEIIYARKCKIKKVSYECSKFFLEGNHIQGHSVSSSRYGLYYNEELVALMTLGNSRFEKNKIELHRYCSKLDTNVAGGAGKLFKYALKENPEWNEIISYADRSWSIGNLYKNLGFYLEKKTPPNYSYVIDGLRINRMKFQKSKLVSLGYDKNKTEVSIMHGREYYRIYDSGNLKYVYVR